MASPPLFHLLCFLLLLLLQPPFSSAVNLHKLNHLTSAISNSPALPTRYFEVTKPITLPKTKPCSHLILQHDFAYTYGKPPVFADYTPPSHCPSQIFTKIILEWTATSKGRQFDRIFGVWLSGVELLRSCTAEPRTNGIVWTVEKDITRYSSLLQKNQTLAVYLGNLIDKTYTGVYHVNLTLHFYPAEENAVDHDRKNDSWADLIVPISRNLPLKDGLWFKIENSSDTEVKEFVIPRNAYRAVLEVYVSFHENDEFWYGNPSNDYIAANNLSVPGNGPFREVVVSVDGQVVGAVWPFTVIYTGGVNPLLWRPITAIGSYDLPSYDIEITPFLGKILDGKSHKIGFNVTNALNVWYIDANLHVWLDKASERTKGELVNHSSLPLAVSLVSDFRGLNGTFVTTVSRTISSTGWVKSSKGNITTQAVQDLSYINTMIMAKNGDAQIVEQNISFNDTVKSRTPFSLVQSLVSHKTFPLYLYIDSLEQENSSYLLVTNVSMGLIEKKIATLGSRYMMNSLKNLQKAEGNMVVKDNLVVSGVGNTQQVYRFHGGKSCYLRNVSSSNYTLVYDKVEDTCNSKQKSDGDFGLRRLWPFGTGLI